MVLSSLLYYFLTIHYHYALVVLTYALTAEVETSPKPFNGLNIPFGSCATGAQVPHYIYMCLSLQAGKPCVLP